MVRRKLIVPVKGSDKIAPLKTPLGHICRVVGINRFSIITSYKFCCITTTINIQRQLVVI